MALYTIGDLHLSLAKDKPMDIFGGNWQNHTEKLKNGFANLNDDDVCVICGDLSWGIGLEETAPDFDFINSLPGKKIILKGNHDYWWSTATKVKKFFAERNITTIDILYNNFFEYKDIAICGTRGWFYEEEKGGDHDKKILNREIMRLETSLKAAGDREKMVFLHYPPVFAKYECPEILELLRNYRVSRCYYGHIHGKGRAISFNGQRDGTHYKLVSADNVDFCPVKVLDY